MGSDINSTVAPHQLCQCCQRVAAAYTPDSSWRRDKFFAGMTADEVEKLRKAYEETTDLEPLEDTPDILLYWRSKEPVKHHRDLATLDQSAEDGCHLCALFVSLERRAQNRKLSEATLPSSSRSEGQLYIAPLRRSRCSPGAVCTTLGLFDVYPGMVASEYRATNKLRAVSMNTIHYHRRRLDSEDNSIDHASVLQIETGQTLESRFRWCNSTEAHVSFELVTSWLQKCFESHPRCNNSIDTQRPKRLLDLGVCVDDIRLVLEHETSAQPYATLSYRWGTTAAVTLTYETCDAFFAKIELQSLPRIIQDTIQFCRGLSIRYLWVDALCIIQGDAQDFSEEISRMGAIYANSVLTIAAADSVDSGVGFHRPRFPLYREDCLMWQDEDHLIYFSDALSCSLSLHRRETYTLDSRAWAYQERMMAPRTLRFTADEIVWECRESQMCQRCTDDAFRTSQMKRRKKAPNHKEIFSSLQQDLGGDPSSFIRLFELKTTALQDSSVSFRFHIFWNQIVSDYSRTNLSHDQDKLSALAGIAALPQQQLRYQASFGLWHPFFLDELVWSVDPDSRRYNSLKEVPSWSWIGINGGVHKLSGRSSMLHELLPQRTVRSASIVRLPTATTFTEISALCDQFPQAMSFRISTWLAGCRPVPCVQRRGGIWDWTLIPTERSMDTYIQEFVASAGEIYRHCLSGESSPTAFRQLGFETRPELSPLRRIEYYPDVETEPTRDLVCCLIKRILYIDDYEGRGTGASILVDYGIVLELAPDTSGCYRRRGVYKEEIWCKDVGCASLHDMGHNRRYVHESNDQYDTLGLEHLIISREKRFETVIELV
ncbi:heterokaryon incompatibility protein-domain-containing protein [Xylaria scruposa]|nr:heterokaryon incompatibility protein-domain-containing protein [Xylaria scruposa]